MVKRDIPFRDDTSRYFLPWMSFLMVFIALLFLLFGFKAQNVLDSWRMGVSGAMTVQIPTFDNDGHDRGDAVQSDIERALTVLRASDGILGAEVISDTRMEALMSPWMGEKTDITLLPVPKLIDVSVDTAHLPDLTLLKGRLAEQVPAAVLDSHRIWLDSLLRAAFVCMQVITGILVLLVLTAAFTVIYSTKSSLSVHTPVIGLIHMIGASDFYIATQYAFRSFKLILIGGLFGLAGAVLVDLAITSLMHYWLSDISWALSMTEWQWVGVILFPFLMAGLAFGTTYATVIHYLKRFL